MNTRRIAGINGGLLVSGDGLAPDAAGELDFAGFDVQRSNGIVTISGGAGARSVTAYGAVGDGVTDDTAAIQAAIDVGPGLVTFPPGSYLVTQIVRNQGVILMGAGVPGTRILATAPTDAIIASPAPNFAASPTVRGGGVFEMLIDGGSSANAGSVAIDMSQNYDAIVSGVTTQNVERGVVLQNSAYWNIIEGVRSAATVDSFVVRNNANQNMLLGCHSLATERGLVVEEGPDGGVSNLIADGFAVEQFTVAGVDLDASTPNGVDSVSIRNTRFENAVVDPGIPGCRLAGNERAVDIIDPLFVNLDTFVSNPQTDTRILWRAQEKNGVRVGVLNDFSTTSHGLLVWVASQSRLHLRNSTNSVYEDIQVDGVYMGNGVWFGSGTGDPNTIGGTGLVRARGSFFTDAATGDIYTKTTPTLGTGWVQNGI